MKQIKFYRKKSGKCPVEEFLDSLQPKHVQKVTWTLRLIEEMDQVPAQYFKKLKNTDDIWEVRTRMGSHSFRLLGFITGDEFVVLTNGFKKKSQKTPKQEIELAERRKANYLARNGGSHE
ncbi:type II toxin-antitoxin system RelE/ParE family toxin [Fodinibius sp.]|uniref:type II toxin-antitoxin system RelE/ParE family toxin n=1 Tax=Fodinibius sp. TaxID=1872440 RepID=UPI002ACDC907|nr:type II toxin-antitoxin system RelE/ParE family toxin [Fodinibius sp.]MDZ7658775.1 type II toxin-antitoxin system RelE/ParE family toxin [Fodinibius sp.]